MEMLQDTGLCRTHLSNDGPVRYSAFSDDSSVIVACGYSQTEIVAADNGEVLRCWPHGFPSISRAVEFHPGSGRVAGVDDSGAIHVRDIECGLDSMVNTRGLVRFFHRELQYSPDGRWLAICSDEGRVDLWQSDGLEPALRWQKTLPRACRLVFSPENRYLIAGNDQKKLRAWRVVTGDPVPALEAILTGLVAFRPDGGQLAVVERDRGVILMRFWQWPERRLLLEVKSRHTVQERSREELIYSPGGHTLALITASYIFFWDAVTGLELGYVTGFSGVPSCGACSFTPDGTRFIAGDSVGIIRIWNCRTGKLAALLSGHSHEVSTVAVSPDGSQFVSGDADGILRVWDLARCDGVCEVRGHTAAISALAMGASGKVLATGDYDGYAYIWDLQNPTEQSCQMLEDNMVRELHFRPDQKQLAVMGGKNLKVFEAGQTVFSFSTDNPRGLDELAAMAFSRDSKRLAMGYNRSGLELQLWDRRTGSNYTLTGLAGTEQIFLTDEAAEALILAGGRLEKWDAVHGCRRELAAPTATFQPGSAVSSRNGEWLAWLGTGQINFWHLGSGRLVRRESNHAIGKAFIQFRQDGRQLAVWEENGRISLWSPRLGQCVGRLSGEGKITALAYSDSGRTLAAGRPDGSVCLWTGPLPSLHRKMPHMPPKAPDEVLCPGPSEPEATTAGEAVVQLAFAHSDRFLLALDSWGRLRLWNCVTKTEQYLPPGLPGSGITGLAVKGSWLAAALGARIFAADLAGQTAALLGEHEGRIRRLQFVNEPMTVVTADAREIRRWDLQQLALRESREFQEASGLFFSPDSRYMAASHLVTERVMSLWETETYRLLLEKALPEPQTLRRMVFTEDNTALQLIYAEAGREVWDLQANRILPLEASIRMETKENSPWALGIEVSLALLRWRWRSGELVGRIFLPYFSSRLWRGKDSLSPDLSRAAVYRPGDWQVELWDVAGQKSLAVLSHAAAIGCACFSRDGRRLVTGDSDGVIKLWDANTGALQEKIDSRSGGPWVQGGIQQAALSPDGRYLALGQQEGWLLLWPLQTGAEPIELAGHLDTLSSLDFSPDGRFLLSGDFAGIYKLWDVAGEREIGELAPESRKRGRIIAAREWTSDSTQLIFADESGKVRVLSTASGKETGTWSSDIWRPLSLTCRPGRPECLAVAGASGTVGLGRMDQQGTTVFTCRATEGLTQAAFSRDGHVLAAGDAGGRIVVMDGDTGKELNRLVAPSTVRWLTGAAMNEEELTVVADSVKISLSSLENPQQAVLLQESGPMPQQYSISADGNWVAASFERQRAVLWDVRSGEKWPLPDRGPIDHLEFSAGGQYLIMEYHNGRSLLWDTLNHRIVELELPDAHHADRLIFLGGGKRLIGRIQRRTNLWDVATGAKIRTLPGEVRQPEWVSPDGRYVLLFNESSQEFRVVDLEDMSEKAACAATGIHVHVSWSDDSQTVCLGHNNRSPQWLKI